MKKMALLIALTSMSFAQEVTENTHCNRKNAEPPCPKQEFAWGITLCGLAVIGVVAGVTAGMASGN